MRPVVHMARTEIQGDTTVDHSTDERGYNTVLYVDGPTKHRDGHKVTASPRPSCVSLPLGEDRPLVTDKD